MKGFLGVCLAALVIYTIYYDLEVGTVPKTTKAATVQAEMKHSGKAKTERPFQQKKVQPGDTVLSIVEQLNGSETVGIQKIVHDFDQLNPGVNANQIQIGKTYRFPLYNKKKHKASA